MYGEAYGTRKTIMVTSTRHKEMVDHLMQHINELEEWKKKKIIRLTERIMRGYD